MSHIVKSEDTYYMLSDAIYDVEKYGISTSLIMYLMDELMPKQYMIDYHVVASKYGEGETSFNLSKKKVEIYSGKTKGWVNCCTNILIDEFNIKDRKVLQGYHLIQVLAHEIEHAYQYLFGLEIFEPPYSAIGMAYCDIYNMLDIGYDKSKVDYYFKHFRWLLLERNAQIESTDLILNLAYFNSRQDIYDAYSDLVADWIILGYRENTEGNILETYRELGLNASKLDINIKASEDEKVRYGFPILEETREEVLRRVRKDTNV